MKQRSKKLLGVLLTLALLLSLVPAMALTASADYQNGAWSTNQSITEDTDFGLLTVNADITVTIDEGKVLNVHYGIVATGHTLTVAGKGTLTVDGKTGDNTEGTTDSSGGNGFTGKEIIVNGANVTVKGGNAGWRVPNCPGGNGVTGNVTVKSGSFNATGGNGGNGSVSNGGAGVSGNVTVEGGNATITGGTGSYGGGNTSDGNGGVGVNGNVTVTGGDAVVTGGDTPGYRGGGSVGKGITGTITGSAEGSANGTFWHSVSGTSTSDQYVKVTPPPITEYPLWVGGTQVTSANAGNIDGNNKASYNADTKTLTLNGYSYTGVGYKMGSTDEACAAIYWSDSDNPLTIQLSGTNSIVRTGQSDSRYGDGAYYGIYSPGDIIIKGPATASLSVDGGDTESQGRKISYGIFAKTTIQDVQVTASGTSTGISSLSAIQRANVTATGGSFGISSYTLEISENSTVTATGGISAIDCSGPPECVKNAIPGTGWTNTEGTEGKTTIAVSTEGQDISSYKKVQFPAVHEHSFTYSASGATITAECGGTGACDITEGLTLTVSAPTGTLVYDGTTTYPATLSTGYNTTAFPDTYTISYTKDGSAYSGAPKDAGAYTASVTVGTGDAAKTASVTFTVEKADSTAATVTGNTVKINDAAKPLVTVTGEATGGTMQYALGSSTEAQNEFAANIPTTDDIGAAGTFYVWYKVKGDANHNDTAPACATATVTEEGQTLYTLTYDPNGGTGEMADESYESGATVTVKNNTFTAPANKEFDGWNTKADGTGTAYKAGDTFAAAADVTLYAQWSAVTAEVDFKPDAGSGSAVQNVESDTEALKELVKDVPAGSTVDVKLLAKASEDLTKMPDSELDEQQKAVKAAQSGITITANETDGVQNLDFLDFSILKTVDGSQSYITETGETVLAIKISYNTANKTDFAVYRQHDGKTESFTRLFAEPTGNFKDATFFVGDGYIMVYSSRFSTYAIGYNVQTNTFDLYTGSADHKDVEVSLGGMSVYSVSADTEGDPAVTLNDYSVEADTLTLKSAYLSRLAVGTHKFSVYAVANDTDPLAVTVEVVDTTPTASFGGISEPHYHIILAETVNGTAKVSRTTAPRGATVTVTATPDEGYVLDAIKAVDAKGNDVEVKDGKFTMPAADVTVTVTFAAEGCDGGDACPLSAFTDLDPDAWYHDGVHFVLETGLMQGYGNGLFGPNDTTTRAMVVTMLYRMEGEPMIRSGMPFSDVKESDWYAKAVSWAESQGIVKGFEDGTFRPNDPITREQLATILYRYAQTKGEGFTGMWSFRLDFPDAGKVADWADEAMHWCVMQGIIKGMDGALNPQGDATRAQLATMVQRFCALLSEK